MLVFIDESGDPGFKFDQGSSRFFTIALVVFEDTDDAIACDKRIELLHAELHWQGEFHFRRSPDHVRDAFIRAVVPYNFFYYGVVIDKEIQLHLARQFRNKSAFYQYVCGLVFESAREKIQQATIVIDASGNLAFRRELAHFLRTKMNTRGSKRIGKVKMQRSERNNLIQLADYVTGIIHRSVQQKKHGDTYRRLISRHEIEVRLWPSMT